MVCLLKLRAKERIRSHYALYLFFIICEKASKALIFVLPVAAYFMFGRTALSAVCAASGGITAFVLHCVIYIKAADVLPAALISSKAFLRRTLYYMHSWLLFFVKKTAWCLLFMSPSVGVAFIAYRFAEDIAARILYFSAALTAVVGYIFYRLITDIYKMKKYLSARGLTTREYTLKNRSRVRRDIFLFELGLMPWRLLCVLPPAALYVLPYTAVCESLYFGALVNIARDPMNEPTKISALNLNKAKA